MAILFSKAQRLVKFGRGHYDKHFCEIYIEFGPVVPEMSFKDITIFRFCTEAKDLCNFCREYYEEHFCEAILKRYVQ